MDREGRSLRILEVITTLDVGGAEHHLESLCRGLVEHGHRVDVIDLKGRATLQPRFEALGIDVRRAETVRPLGYLRALIDLYRACRRERYDLVHTHLLKANALGAVAARLAGIRAIVASKHNDETQLHNPLVARLHRLCARLDRRFIHASHHIARFMTEVGGLPERKGVTIHYGIDQGPDSTAEATDDGVIIICVARLIRRKGHLTLLDAFRQIADEENVSLWIVGDGEMAAPLRRRVADCGLDDRVWFAGERLDVPMLLARADIFVLASEAEGLGLVLLEAMNAGLPTVATRAGGMPELVDHDATGVLVEVDDTTGLASALRRLVRDGALRARLGGAGRERVASTFSHTRMIERTLDVYWEVVATAGDTRAPTH